MSEMNASTIQALNDLTTERNILARDLKIARQENARLREALGDAIDSYEEYAQYAGDYLMKKHRVDEDIAELRKVLESSDDKHSP